MNLYLSSYLVGDHADRLLAMAGGHGARMAIVTNALDAIAAEDQLVFARSRFDVDEYFAGHGFDASFVDLRRYSGRPEALCKLLLRHKVIWVLGGNTFLLRRAMRDSGFDEIIAEVLGAGVVYGGWSAGACVAGDDLRAVALMDEPYAEAKGYLDSDVVWEGLGLLPFTIIPHYRSDHAEAALAEKAVTWATDHKMNFKALSDGDVLVVEDGGAPNLLPRRG